MRTVRSLFVALYADEASGEMIQFSTFGLAEEVQIQKQYCSQENERRLAIQNSSDVDATRSLFYYWAGLSLNRAVLLEETHTRAPRIGRRGVCVVSMNLQTHIPMSFWA